MAQVNARVVLVSSLSRHYTAGTKEFDIEGNALNVVI